LGKILTDVRKVDEDVAPFSRQACGSVEILDGEARENIKEGAFGDVEGEPPELAGHRLHFSLVISLHFTAGRRGRRWGWVQGQLPAADGGAVGYGSGSGRGMMGRLRCGCVLCACSGLWHIN
jgi:hypothetical protein